MISIIICSRSRKINKTLDENIKNTIGCNYELIIIDNSNKEYLIFSAYNEGVKRAQFPYLCFMHDDILFRTDNWGEKVIEYFKDPKVGIIGVAGTHYIPRAPGCYWISGIASINVIHTINGNSHLDKSLYDCKSATSISSVLVDGLWFCIPKALFRLIRFDEGTYDGFHFYDYDICMQIFTLKYTNLIITNILIEHFSSGKRETSWLKNCFSFYYKWKKYLPVSSINLTPSEKAKADYLNAKDIIETIKRNNFGLGYILKVWFYYIKIFLRSKDKRLKYLFYLLKTTLQF